MDDEMIEMAAAVLDEEMDDENPMPGMDEGGPEDEDGVLTDEVFSGILKAGIEDAVQYIDSDLGPERAMATSYYKGAELGNEEEGRSQIVMTEVRDTVQTMLPELLKIFFESDNIVEFEPNREDTVQDAAQQSDYINHIVMQENGGVKLFFDVFKDALIRKTGIVKWFIDDTEEITEEEYTGLSGDQYLSLMEDEDIEELEYFEKELPETADVEIDVRVRRINTERRYVVEAVPPEEFFWARDTRDLENCNLCGHRRYMSMSDLVSMGYNSDEIEEHGGGSASNFVFNQEATARNPALQNFLQQQEGHSGDPAMRMYEYYETYIRVDYDNDGIAELRKVCSLGQAHHVLDNEVVPDIPFAVFCPDPEPHMLAGQSIADQICDLQRIKTAVVRNTLDSLAQTVNPRTAVIEGAVNMDDVMNTETGAIIRTRMAGAVTPLVEPFVGQYALPIIQYLDDVRASRTGITKASQGLDPNLLQSTTKEAVTGTMNAAAARVGLVARIFAETGFRRLMQGLLRLVARTQDKPRMMKLRGTWTEVDPRSWDISYRMSINVGLGTGQKQERMAALGAIAGKQEQLLLQLGPINPLCSFKEYRYTLGKMTELAGHKDTTNFFKAVTDEDMAKVQKSMAEEKKPSIEEVMADIERMKAQAGIQESREKNALNAIKLKMEDDTDRDKIVADTLVKLVDIETKTGVPVNAVGILAELRKDRGDFNGAGSGAPMPQAPPRPVNG